MVKNAEGRRSPSPLKGENRYVKNNKFKTVKQ